MQSNQTLTRRLVPALAVTVVATLVFGAVVVTADVASGAEPLLPESFAVAAPRQGDAWRYNVTLTGEWTFGAEDQVRLNDSLPFGEFQWAGAGPVRGGDGRLHDANYLHALHLAYEPLRLVHDDEDCDEETSACYAPEDPIGDDEEPQRALVSQDAPYWSESMATSGWVMAGARSVVSRGDLFAQQENVTNYGFGSGPVDLGLGAYYERHYSAYGYIEYPQDEVPCLVFNPLQGGNVSLAGEIGLFEPCSLGGQFLTVPEGLSFRATGVEEVAGVQAIRFEGRQNGTYQVWFTPEVPYPVRIAFQLPNERKAILEAGDVDAPGDRRAVLEMVGFRGGTDLLDDVDDPVDAQAAPPLAQGAPVVIEGVRLGPDETGVTHPFPLSKAFSEALEQPNFASLRTYLTGKTGVYAAAAQYFENGRTSMGPSGFTGHARTWLVGLTNGEEDFGFAATMQTFEGYAPLAVRDQLQGQEPLYSFDQYYGPEFYWEDAPALGAVPASLATQRSLADRWAAFDGSGLEANNFGFRVGCAQRDEAEDPCEVVVEYLVGHNRANWDSVMSIPGNSPFVLPGNPYGTEQHIMVDRTVAFEGDGTASQMLVMDERSYRSDANSTLPSGDPSPLPPFMPPSDPGYQVQSSEVTGIPSSSLQWLPEGKEAASVTFMGLVVGALYWVWPKLGMVGLFSRLHRGELLDHPARAKLVQIVESQPGIHFHDLAGKAELANGTAVHHLRKLTDSGHLSARRTGRYTCYFPGGRVDPHVAAAAPLLKSEGAKQVLEAVRAKPGMSNLEVAQATGLQPSTVNYHVQRLSQAGLVAALRDGRNVRLHPGVRAGAAGPTGPGDGLPAAGAAA